MQKTCPYCKEPFEAASESTESCRKAACVKANQRAKKRAAAGVTEVKRGRPRKHPRPENELASEVVQRLKPVQQRPEPRVPASSILSRLTVKLPSEDKRGPLVPKPKSKPQAREEQS